MLTLTLNNLSSRMQLNHAKAVCEQFWLDARREGVTPRQRSDVFACMSASGYLQIPIAGECFARLYWSASVTSAEPSEIVLDACEQNPGIHLYGPVTLLSHGLDAEDALCVKILSDENLVDRIRSALLGQVELITPESLFAR